MGISARVAIHNHKIGDTKNDDYRCEQCRHEKMPNQAGY